MIRRRATTRLQPTHVTVTAIDDDGIEFRAKVPLDSLFEALADGPSFELEGGVSNDVSAEPR